MCHNGVAAVHHAGVIAALVEHAQIAAQHTGEVHVAVHGALVGRDDHEVILVEGNVRHMMQQALEHLIGGHNVIEAHQGHSVHYAGVMSIKSDDIVNTHTDKLLKSECAVQRFTTASLVLTAFI